MRLKLNTGYSLLEIMLVLAILILAISIIPPSISNVIASSELKSSVRIIASELILGQGQAIRKHKESVFSFNAEKHQYSFNKKTIQLNLPPNTQVSLIVARSEMTSDHEGNIRFFPDGSSTGGQIKISYSGQNFTVDVHWLTGKVRILNSNET